MRAVIDTNILISGFISNKSYPARVLDAWILNKFNPVVSREIIREYTSVFLREKFDTIGSKENRKKILKQVLELSWVVLVYPEEKLNVVKEDPKDNMFLECAIEGKCLYVVSGDRHLLEIGEFRGVKILTAGEFITLLDGVAR